MFCQTSLFLLVASGAVMRMAEAATAIGLATINKDLPDQCIDEDSGRAYGLDASWPMKGMCGEKTCYKRGATLYVSYRTCGYSQASPPCYTVENLSLEYPGCCPRVVCEQDSANEIDTEDYSDYGSAAGRRDEDEELYMMSSNDAPVAFNAAAPPSSNNIAFYDVDMGGDFDLLAASSEAQGTEDYMIDWDTLFAQKK